MIEYILLTSFVLLGVVIISHIIVSLNLNKAEIERKSSFTHETKFSKRLKKDLLVAILRNEKVQIQHVIPLDDLKEHSEDVYCECNPTLHNDGVCVHNSFDMRELSENINCN